MKQLIIGLDIDGVIIDYIRSILPLLSEICQRQINYEDITHPSLTRLLDILDIDEETTETIWKQILETDLLLKSPPVEGALEGLGLLTHTLDRIRHAINPELQVRGVVLTMFDARTNLSSDVVHEVRNFFPNRVFQSIIPRSGRLAEAPSHSVPISEYDPKSAGAEAYMALAREILVGDGVIIPAFQP